jgi:integrase
MRVLGACWQSAIVSGYATRNPVRALPRGEKPKAEMKESAYFETEELPRLFAEVPDGVVRVLFETVLKTGMREGELVALTWGNVDLLDRREIRVRTNWTAGKLSTPKNRERREVDLTPELIELLGRWSGELGHPGDDQLVFPGDGPDGYLSVDTILKRELYPAMKRAGIDRVGPTGEKRTFHSFRHTYAKLARERVHVVVDEEGDPVLDAAGQVVSVADPMPIDALSRMLGHSSTAVTDTVYGHWGRDEKKNQAEKMAGVFGV